MKLFSLNVVKRRIKINKATQKLPKFSFPCIKCYNQYIENGYCEDCGEKDCSKFCHCTHRTYKLIDLEKMIRRFYKKKRSVDILSIYFISNCFSHHKKMVHAMLCNASMIWDLNDDPLITYFRLAGCVFDTDYFNELQRKIRD